MPEAKRKPNDTSSKNSRKRTRVSNKTGFFRDDDDHDRAWKLLYEERMKVETDSKAYQNITREALEILHQAMNNSVSEKHREKCREFYEKFRELEPEEFAAYSLLTMGG